MTGEVSPNGVQTTLSYNALDDLTSPTINKGGVLAGYAYTYNASGQRLRATEHSGRSATYTYDVLARLATESVSGDPNSSNNGSVNYSLDPVGNRLARTSTLAAIPATTSTYDANDRLTSDTYDANGNTRTSSGVNYAYKFENRLTSRDSAGSSLTFIYDGDGNRVGRTSGGLTTRYLVDELNPTGYAQVIDEIAAGSVQRTYTYGHSLISQTEIGSNQVSFFGRDAHGSVRLLTNRLGEVTDTYDYDAFGNVVTAFGGTRNDYLYSGERFDSEPGAYHQRERYYKPASGRFLTSDPFAGFTDLPRTLHRYSYVGADPVNFIDPSGLAETTEYKGRTIQPKPRLKPDCIMTLVEWLGDAQDLLELAKVWHRTFPEWQGIDPDRTPVKYVPQDKVKEIRKMRGEAPGHHPHPLSLGGPPGQTLTPTGDTRRAKNRFHQKVSDVHNKIKRHITGKICR